MNACPEAESISESLPSCFLRTIADNVQVYALSQRDSGNYSFEVLVRYQAADEQQPEPTAIRRNAMADLDRSDTVGNDPHVVASCPATRPLGEMLARGQECGGVASRPIPDCPHAAQSDAARAFLLEVIERPIS
jgi:hypothetical protein